MRETVLSAFGLPSTSEKAAMIFFSFFFFCFIVVFCYDRSSPCFVQREEKVNKKKKKKSSLWEVLSERGTGYDALHLIPFFTPRFLLSL